MRRDSTDRGRSVHPAMVRAVLSAPGRPGGRSAAGTEAERLLDRGAPVPERLHARLLGELWAAGPAALTGAAERLLADAPPPLAELATADGLAELTARAALVEPWFHVGHRTGAVLDDRGLTVRHTGRFGGAPQLPESLFVCALYAAGAAAVVGRPPEVRLLSADGGDLPPAAARTRPPVPVVGWRLLWTRGAPVAEVGPATAVRGWIAQDPGRAWRLAQAAERLGCSSRSLQRELARAGTGFQAELLAVRLGVAAQLISRTSLPLAEVAASAGFTDHAHLAHRFRAAYGCAPSQYRAAARPGVR
ncbi:helix-turn-helix transcriptional regulator [Kitasatospora sp. NPDC088346]|uniref:helix-turn-helix transcriptional regulator n=1 Tax=Kitasatospora sp. NPDC088346 TaxID=3364073 RepID=UPI0037FA4AE6